MSDLPALSKKLTPISKLNIDILTISIGPEHHDIRLLDINVKHNSFFINYKSKNTIGRLSFNVACAHLESISIRIKYLNCKISDLWQNEVCFKLRYRVNNNI